LGIIYRDQLQDVALNSRLPILIYKPQSILSQAIYRVADKILQLQMEDKTLIDLQNIEDSYLVAEMEARVDFNLKIQHMEELLHCGALTRGDLMDTVKNQQFELQRMKRENQALKNRLAKAIKSGYKI
jgi:flagellar biosynthesis protein FlhG